MKKKIIFIAFILISAVTLTSFVIKKSHQTNTFLSAQQQEENIDDELTIKSIIPSV